MNEAVIGLSVVVGLLVGGLIWWSKRSLVAAILVPVILVFLVSLALPKPVAPVGPPVARPPAGESQTESVGTEDTVSGAGSDLSTEAKLAMFRPIETPDHGYVASDACSECHADQHASWFASYHRTMTQVARPEAMLGDFDDVTLSQNGREYHLREVDGVCWVEMLDPAALPGTVAERVQRPIVMSTGSHHMQLYWFPVGVRRTLGMLPFVYLKETQEWIPRSAAFVRPARDFVSHEIGRWNSGCSKCHSTHPQEREVTVGEWDTRAVEFGISCEACHGPGQQHIAYHRGLAVAVSDGDDSVASQSSGGPDAAAVPTEDPIVNPDNLSHVRSSQVCGQCHSVMTLKGDPAKINVDGVLFRPGMDLRDSHDVWQLHSPEMDELLKNEAMHDRVVQTNRGTFYSDGLMRVAGREYTSLEQSACFQQGEMGCLSCHQLHKSDDDLRSDAEWADDQLKPNARGNEACIGCHDPQQYSTAHTHHRPDSSGSNCYNCHMPHTAYGLLKAIRNHTITVPDLKKDLLADRPNACNQCHLDKTLKWTADHLEDWYSIEQPELDVEQTEIAASILWLLKGNAASRAMAAWAMGWSDAQAVSGNDWQAIYLAQMFNDPYHAVRMIARRSLQTLPEFAELEIDAVGSDAERNDVILSIIQRWDQDSHTANAELLLGPNNAVRTRRIDALMNQRDDTPMNLAE